MKQGVKYKDTETDKMKQINEDKVKTGSRRVVNKVVKSWEANKVRSTVKQISEVRSEAQKVKQVVKPVSEPGKEKLLWRRPEKVTGLKPAEPNAQPEHHGEVHCAAGKGGGERRAVLEGVGGTTKRTGTYQSKIKLIQNFKTGGKSDKQEYISFTRSTSSPVKQFVKWERGKPLILKQSTMLPSTWRRGPGWGEDDQIQDEMNK